MESGHPGELVTLLYTCFSLEDRLTHYKTPVVHFSLQQSTTMRSTWSHPYCCVTGTEGWSQWMHGDLLIR